MQRGTEAELTFNGDRLDDVQEVLFFEPGVTVLKLEEVKPKTVRARLKVAPDCPLGEHKARLRAASGVSELDTFYVGPFPQVEETEPNTERSQAQKVPLNCTVNGRITNEDVDYFAIEAKKGQRLSAEVEGMRLGRNMFDPYVAIRDAQGNELARADDTPLLVQDGFVSIVAPADGLYLVEVHETSYGGGGDPYRLHVGTFPRPTAVYPAGGKAGEKVELKFLGDPAGEFTQTVTLPAPTPQKHGVFAVQNGVTAPSPNYIRVSEFPNVLEAEPNDEPKQATATTAPLPLAFNGIIARDGDVDWFRFRAAKGQVYDVRVHARFLRSPLDPVLTIANADGGVIAGNDDSGGPDSFLKFTVPRDGEFLIKVTDHLGKGGPDFVYRVEIAPPQPSLTTYIADTARYDTQTRKSIVVARGNRYATMMTVRRNNVGGDVLFGSENLPAGLSLTADVVTGGLAAIPVVFEAKSDAPIAGKLMDIAARTAKPKEAKDFREVRGGVWQNYDLVQQGNDGIFYQTFVDKIAVAVVEELPFKVSIVEPKAPLLQSGSLDLKVVAERKAGFDEPITLKMLFNPPGVGSQPEVTIAKGASSAVYTLNANSDAPVRDWKIAVLASSTVKGGTAYASTQLATVKVAEPALTGKIDMANIMRGNPVNVVCKLDQRTPFEGKATVRLVGLPAGATAPEKQITKDDKQVTFEVATTPNAAKGVHRTLFCSVALALNGEPVTQNLAGGGTLRIDAPRTQVADAKPATAAKPATNTKQQVKNKRAK